MWHDDLKFRWDLRCLQKRKGAIWAKHKADMSAARDSNEWEQEQSIASVAFHEVDMMDAEIRSLQHRYLTRQAERLLLPLPQIDTKSGNWVRSEYDGSWTLSDKFLTQLNRDVRNERRERLDLLFLWPSASIGLVGGLVGILTAFL